MGGQRYFAEETAVSQFFRAILGTHDVRALKRAALYDFNHRVPTAAPWVLEPCKISYLK